MIKAIIFDCFGVLVTEGLAAFNAKYFNNDQALIKKAEFYLHQGNKGLITNDEVVKHYALIANISADEALAALSFNPVNEELFAFIEDDIKLKYKLGFLSNASDDWLEDLFTPDQLGLFDAFVLSYQTGFAKPEPQIYEIMTARLGVRLDECVFFDDRQDYVNGAIAVGIPAFVYTSVAKLQYDLATVS